MLPEHWTQYDLAVDGHNIHYYRTGNGEKPALVLVHGFSDNGLCWLPTALDLEDEYDIIMPEARGHGQSERIVPGKPVDMPADLAGLLTALELERPIVAGHSMGAMEAFQLGVRWPQIPRALILEDPPWRQPGGAPFAVPGGQHPMAPLVENIQRSTLDELIAQAREEHFAWSDTTVNAWCTAKKQLDPSILSIVRIQGDEWPEAIPQLQCPTLIFTADPDKGGIVTPEIAARAEELNPLVRVRHVPSVGHHIRFEDYETYMETFRTFLKEVG